MMYLKGKDFVSDFASRTLMNIKKIENMKDDDGERYEVTQLINSLLGLIVFPNEYGISGVGLNSLKPYIIHDNGKSLLRNLRNAIGHGHILFEEDNVKLNGKAQIKSVTFINCNFNGSASPCPDKAIRCDRCRLKSGAKEKPDFQLTVPIEELRTCVEAFAIEIINRGNQNGTTIV